ncbi:MAG: hypothetical protein EOO75_16400, partial [Myxococcales bacterium]
MQRRYLWCAVVFAAVPALVFACGGRSDIDLLLESTAGAGGTGGKGGAGTAGQGGAAGATGLLCAPGLQVGCACPGTDLEGVQT